MLLWWDYNIAGCRVQNNEVHFFKYDEVYGHSLRTNQGLNIFFTPRPGTIAIQVAAFDAIVPATQGSIGSMPRTVGDPENANTITVTDSQGNVVYRRKNTLAINRFDLNLDVGGVVIGEGGGGTLEEDLPPDDGRPNWNHVPVNVELFAPEGESPLRSWQTQEKPQRNPFYQEFDYEISTHIPGTWKLVATNISEQRSKCKLRMHYKQDIVPIKQTSIPLRMLNHSVSTVLEAIGPRLVIRGDDIIFSFNKEVQELSRNSDGVSPFDDILVSLPEGADVQADMQHHQITATTGAYAEQKIEAILGEKRQKLLDLYQKVADENKEQYKWLQAAALALEQQIQNWKDNIDAQGPCIEVQIDISDISVGVDLGVLGDIDLGDIQNAKLLVLLPFDQNLFLTDYFYDFPVRFTGVLGAIQKYFYDFRELLDEKIRAVFTQQIKLALGRYLGEAIIRTAEQDDVLVQVSATENAWIASHCNPPGTPRKPEFGGDIEMGGVGSGVLTRLASAENDDTRRSDPPPVTLPFDLGDPDSIERLDGVDTMIFLMMENRSYDHMFGFLSMKYGEKYEGLNQTYSNPPSYPFTQNIETHEARHVLNNSSVTQVRVSPNHHYDHVMRQIAGGEMSGFAADLMERAPENPEIAMMYYTDDELPIMYQLAKDYAVCDHWYCAHPGATWPNRISTLSGWIPDLDNFENHDRRIGYLQQKTIFDLLDKYGIEWKYFESDMCFLRMFDKYRLNDTNIVPIDDPVDGYEASVSAGTLPPVVFIDPNFVDVPPVETANDDHPPADLQLGQEFISRIYNTLADSDKEWGRKNPLFVITYDEHGGFFDHVPPVGTSAGPEEWVNNVPPIHIAGPSHMGPRVPTLVISPMVQAGTANKTILDHTSILKSILVRFREKISAEDLASFSDRVNTANHLGMVLNQSRPRTDRPDRVVTGRPPVRGNVTRPTYTGGVETPRSAVRTSVLTSRVIRDTQSEKEALTMRNSTLEKEMDQAHAMMLQAIIDKQKQGKETLADVNMPDPEHLDDEDPRSFHAGMARAYHPRPSR